MNKEQIQILKDINELFNKLVERLDTPEDKGYFDQQSLNDMPEAGDMNTSSSPAVGIKGASLY